MDCPLAQFAKDWPEIGVALSKILPLSRKHMFDVAFKERVGLLSCV